MSRALSTLILVVVLAGGPAQARFGKAGSPSASSSSSSKSSSSSSGGGARSTSSSSSSSSSSTSSSSSGDYHSAVPVGSSGGSSSSRGWGWSFFAPRPARHGYYSGAYVPSYGYGYCLRTTTVTTGAVATEVVTGEAQAEETVAAEESGVRVTAGVEGLYLTAGQRGFLFGGGATVEGERFGLTLLGQDIAVQADDGSGAVDHIGVLTARLSFAFLTGKHGRLRFEAGVDTVIAPNLIALGPVLGLSGSLWIAGPLALEGSVFAVPYPYWELDWRAGAVLGLGPVGIRAGWRAQMLDDRGLVDGVAHRDTFMGPYVGLSVVF